MAILTRLATPSAVSVRRGRRHLRCGRHDCPSSPLAACANQGCKIGFQGWFTCRCSRPWSVRSAASCLDFVCELLRGVHVRSFVPHALGLCCVEPRRQSTGQASKDHVELPRQEPLTGAPRTNRGCPRSMPPSTNPFTRSMGSLHPTETTRSGLVVPHKRRRRAEDSGLTPGFLESRRADKVRRRSATKRRRTCCL